MSAHWKSISINDELYIVKIVHRNAGIAIWLSDFKQIWSEEIELSNVLERVKLENALIEYDEQTIFETISATQSTGYQLFEKNATTNTAVLRLKTYISGVPFKFFWKLTLCQQDEFFNEITRATFISMIELQKQHDELLEIIRKKDIEIQQYKIDGATLIRKHVATSEFNKENFRKKFSHQVYDRSFLELTQNDGSSENIKKICNFVEQSYADLDDTDETTVGNIKTEPRVTQKKNKKSTLKEAAALRKFKPKNNVKLSYEMNSSQEDDDFSMINFTNNSDVDEPMNIIPNVNIVTNNNTASVSSKTTIRTIKKKKLNL